MDVQIIVLNGVGSVGKTSIARALQELTATPFLHVQMDTFIDMMPRAMIGDRDGLVFETTLNEGHPTVAIKSGPIMDQTLRGMRAAVAAMAAQGNRLIVDDVILEAADQQDYRRRLSSFEVRFVGLFAPLDILESRERERGDRTLGLARWQYERVHAGMVYDLVLDAGASTAAECAAHIKAAFGL